MDYNSARTFVTPVDVDMGGREMSRAARENCIAGTLGLAV
jgi:hypothetical protein